MSLEALIKKSRATRADHISQSTEVVINADNVDAFLEFNDDNRPFSKSLSRVYAADMLEGRVRLF